MENICRTYERFLHLNSCRIFFQNSIFDNPFQVRFVIKDVGKLSNLHVQSHICYISAGRLMDFSCSRSMNSRWFLDIFSYGSKGSAVKTGVNDLQKQRPMEDPWMPTSAKKNLTPIGAPHYSRSSRQVLCIPGSVSIAPRNVGFGVQLSLRFIASSDEFDIGSLKVSQWFHQSSLFGVYTKEIRSEHQEVYAWSLGKRKGWIPHTRMSQEVTKWFGTGLHPLKLT